MKSPLSFLYSLVFAAVATIVLTGSTPPPGIADIPVSDKIYSISTGPGADASVSIGISWACDTTFKHNCVRVTEVSDTDWTEARDVNPLQHERFTAFQGFSSKAADGTDIVEDAVFTKLGATLTDLTPDTDYK